jgi:hypothetical protein
MTQQENVFKKRVVMKLINNLTRYRISKVRKRFSIV